MSSLGSGCVPTGRVSVHDFVIRNGICCPNTKGVWFLCVGILDITNGPIAEYASFEWDLGYARAPFYCSILLLAYCSIEKLGCANGVPFSVSNIVAILQYICSYFSTLIMHLGNLFNSAKPTGYRPRSLLQNKFLLSEICKCSCLLSAKELTWISLHHRFSKCSLFVVYFVILISLFLKVNLVWENQHWWTVFFWQIYMLIVKFFLQMVIFNICKIQLYFQ